MKPTLLVMVFLVGSFTPAFPKDPIGKVPQSYELNQCAIILDPRSDTGKTTKPARIFLTDPSDQLEAVEVPTGKTLWRTPKATLALLARENRLLATLPPEKGKMGCGFAVLDTRSGKILRKLPSPGGEPLGCVGEGISGSFHMQGITQDGRDCLVWTKKWWPVPGGAAKPPNFTYPLGSSGEKQGMFEVDLDNAALLPPTGNFPLTSLRNQTSPWGGYSIEPFKVGDVTAQAVMESVDNHFSLILRRWKDGKSLPEVSLGEPPWNSCGVVVCADRRYVLGVWQVPDQKDPFLYHVGVYSTSTGEKVADLDATSWPSAAQIYGNILVAYFPNRVFAIKLSSGKEIWTKTLKDLAYHGPYPPAASRPLAPSQQGSMEKTPNKGRY